MKYSINIAKITKGLFIFFLLFICIMACHPTQEKFSMQMDYYPDQRPEVTNEKYDKAIFILKNTYEQIKNDSNIVTYADHLNISTALRMLKEPRDHVIYHLEMAMEKNLESTSEVFLMISEKEMYEGYLSSEEYDSLVTKFNFIKSNKVEVEFDMNEYSIKGNYKMDLLQIINDLKEKDQKFRKFGEEDFERQNRLDQENLLIIDSLYAHYNQYVGRSLVGEKFDYVMWAVIQHADLLSQEKYLPIVWQAVRNNELKEGPLKMLIDRVYLRRDGFQVFGSQAGGKIGSEAQIEEVKEKYKFELDSI